MMLNKSTSGKSTSWKIILIAPALLVFLFLFNIKTVAQVVVEKQKLVSSNEALSEFELSVEISNIKSKEQLEAYIRMFKKYNVQLEFENITRNDGGLITGITAKFLDKNNNSSGSITRQSEDGIKGFIFYYSEKDGAGFRNLTDSPNRDSHAIVRNLGIEPLVFIEGKQYNYSQLEGKAIRVLGDVSSINSVKAVKTYGSAAKDGALIISKGEIIEDLKEELREIDKQDNKVIRDYIQFEKGKTPAFISLNKTVSTKAPKVGKVESTTPSNPNQVRLKDLSIPGKNPVYIVNGKVLGRNAIIDTINPKSISGINVLKGYSATAVYGKDAKDGAIIITTWKQEDSIRSKKYTFTSGKSGLRDSLKLDPIYTYDRVIYRGDSKSKTWTFNTGDQIFYPHAAAKEGRNSFFRIGGKSNYSDKPLVILDGKEMPADFNISSIENERIERMTVINGATAIEKYGDKAQDGAVEVTTKKKNKRE